MSTNQAEVAGPYTKDFYAFQQDGSVRSAQIIVPILLSLVKCDSVVDFGCGVGGWLREFERNGVNDYLGMDGDYVPLNFLKIPADRFVPSDLRKTPELGRRFDLACSLEVAEHLPESSASALVGALVAAAPVVLFSAAIPHQGGTDHINERWPSYWAALFAERGYVAVDCLRPIISGDRRIEFWYRQNLLIFCEPGKCPAGYSAVTNPFYLDRADPDMVSTIIAFADGRPYDGREAFKMWLRSSAVLWHAAKRKIAQRLFSKPA